MMTRKDEILNMPYVDKGAYKVPEGYFDTLNERIMSNIPQESGKAKKHSIFMMPHFRYAVAACMTGLIVSVGTFLYNKQMEKESSIVAEGQGAGSLVVDEYTSDCMDYAMVDKDDYYRYLSEN